MSDTSIFTQIALTETSDCESWRANRWKPTKCECGAPLDSHRRSALKESDVRDYLAHVDALSPCNVIVESTESTGSLLLGSSSACFESSVRSFQIGAIVQTAKGLESFFPTLGTSLAKLEADAGVDVLRMYWTDRADAGLVGLADAIAFVDERRKSGRNVLVNCAQGKSRSSSLVIAYLMSADREQFECDYDKTLAYVKKCRAIAQPNDGFERQLREFAKQLATN
jgi:Dual specificity phosphatase, catalytic domain